MTRRMPIVKATAREQAAAAKVPLKTKVAFMDEFPGPTCCCGAPCSLADSTCDGFVCATKYTGNFVSEHLCDVHRAARNPVTLK